MPTFQIDERAYAYRLTGAGPPLLLLHGFTGSQQNWQAIVAGLFGRFQLLTVDILGHGLAAAPADPALYRLERVAADLAALITAVAPQPLHLLGYSMGGRLALFLALHYPELVQRLVLESASPGLATAGERQQRRVQDEALAAFVEQVGIEPFVDRWEALPLWASQASLPPAVRQRLRRQRLANNPTGLANSLRGMGTGVQPSLWPRLPELAMPVLLLAGEQDGKFVAIARQMAASIPSAHLAIVPGAGHTIHLERPSTYIAIVDHFLAGRSLPADLSKGGV